jgi:hypothetical protein
MLNLIQIPTQKGLVLIGYWINHFYLIIIILFFLQDIDVDDFRLCLIGSTKLMKTQTSQTSLIITISFFLFNQYYYYFLQDIHLNYF